MRDPSPGLVRETRAARGLTQAQAAAEMGVSHRTYTRWEYGTHHATGVYARILREWVARS